MEAIMTMGIFLLFTPMTLLYVIIGLFYAPSYWKKYFPFFIIVIAMLAYCYNPINEPDLYRYFLMVEDYKGLSLAEVLLADDEGLYVINIVFWIIAKVGMKHLLPAISTATVYGVTYYITCDTASRWHCEKKIPIILGMQMLVLPFLSIVNNVRNIWAFSLIILAVYLDIYNKKKKIALILLYIIPCFMHASAILIVALRLILFLAGRIKTIVIIGTASFPLIINLAYSFIDLIPSSFGLGVVIRQTILRMYWYLHDTDSSAWARTVAASKYHQLNRVVMMSIAIIIIVLIYQYTKEQWDKENDFATFVFLLCVMTLACNIFTTPQYWRFSSASMIASGAILIPIMYMKRTLKQKYKVLLFSLYGFSGIALLLQMWGGRGIINIIDYVKSIMLTNVYGVGIQLLKQLLAL